MYYNASFLYFIQDFVIFEDFLGYSGGVLPFSCSCPFCPAPHFEKTEKNAKYVSKLIQHLPSPPFLYLQLEFRDDANFHVSQGNAKLWTMGRVLPKIFRLFVHDEKAMPSSRLTSHFDLLVKKIPEIHKHGTIRIPMSRKKSIVKWIRDSFLLVRAEDPGCAPSFEHENIEC